MDTAHHPRRWICLSLVCSTWGLCGIVNGVPTSEYPSAKPCTGAPGSPARPTRCVSPDLNDSECIAAWNNSEAPVCGLGAQLALIPPGLLWLRRRRGGSGDDRSPRERRAEGRCGV